jgi:hypothetical protein
MVGCCTRRTCAAVRRVRSKSNDEQHRRIKAKTTDQSRREDDVMNTDRLLLAGNCCVLVRDSRGQRMDNCNRNECDHTHTHTAHARVSHQQNRRGGTTHSNSAVLGAPRVVCASMLATCSITRTSSVVLPVPPPERAKSSVTVKFELRRMMHAQRTKMVMM